MATDGEGSARRRTGLATATHVLPRSCGHQRDDAREPGAQAGAPRVPVAPFVLTVLARQRDIDRARAQKRNATNTSQHDKDGLTPAQRRERYA